METIVELNKTRVAKKRQIDEDAIVKLQEALNDRIHAAAKVFGFEDIKDRLLFCERAPGLDAALRAKDDAVAGLEAALRAKDDAFAGLEATLLAKDAALQAKGYAITCLEAALVQQQRGKSERKTPLASPTTTVTKASAPGAHRKNYLMKTAIPKLRKELEASPFNSKKQARLGKHEAELAQLLGFPSDDSKIN